ncbi:hypothetical protein EON65_38875 [archaeon]|nr:MAG: hypothetical protein EON65_38875 [archaeon]
MQLFEYKGRWLTQPEIDLVKFIEGERCEKQKILDERKLEQAMLANSVKTAAAVSQAYIQRILNKRNY